jgi:hypothetical protein
MVKQLGFDSLRDLWSSDEMTVRTMSNQGESLFLTSQLQPPIPSGQFLANASPRPPEVSATAVAVTAAATAMFGVTSGWSDIANRWPNSSSNVLVIAIACALYTLALLTLLGNAIVIHAIRTERKLRTVSVSNASLLLSAQLSCNLLRRTEKNSNPVNYRFHSLNRSSLFKLHINLALTHSSSGAARSM